MTVLIGGGRGFVGKHLTKVLKNNGYDVTIISRQAAKGQITWSEVERNGLPNDCKAVVNVAGENILNMLKRYSDKKYVDEIWKSRVGTSKILANAIKEAEKKPESFVTMSGVGIYPPSKTAEYTEAVTEPGNDWLGKLALEWERAGDLPDNVPTRRVIIRSGVILGKDGGMIEMLRPVFKLFGGQKIGSGQQWLPWIHVDDMAELITYAIKTDSVSGVLNGVAPDLVKNAEFTQAFAAACRRPAFGFVPEFYMKFAFGPERAMVVLQGQKVKPSRTLESGFTYKYATIQDACKELVS
ncbi:epimerase family protein SDR39U1-like [Ruditapes philippinarum]|uniref:epimerase family protein SDR39U1-like n=1 Tax=Ruditapes philippinarum TaxID=129788 RepID=UPI00295BE419|nr:epimerase family protein SDR39U1-like [Ruditapes philippinarum]